MILTAAASGILLLAALSADDITPFVPLIALLLFAASWTYRHGSSSAKRHSSTPYLFLALSFGIAMISWLGSWLSGRGIAPGTLYRWLAGLGFMGAISGIITRDGAERLVRRVSSAPWLHELIQDICTGSAIMVEAFPSRLSAIRLRAPSSAPHACTSLLLASTLDYGLRRAETARESRALRTTGPTNPMEFRSRPDLVMELDRIAVEILGKEVFSEIHLELQQGEWLALLGPSGSGKTTLLRVMAGLRPPSSGTLKRLGTESLRGCIRGIMMTFQNPEHFLLGATPWEDARIGSRISEGELENLFESFELQAEMHQPLSGLSFGQQKQAMLISAIAAGPEILLCDELTSGLDAETAGLLVRRLEATQASRALSVVWCTHDPEAIPSRVRRALVLGPKPRLLSLSEPDTRSILQPRLPMPFHRFNST